ncbi:MAG: trans-aconitate 2-methyltransferase [Frankiaceae bacterium]|nr:trans-aconitate 2-methyltransferase [Frankiaceae bacterium]
MRWDPDVYNRYADERGRPFLELLSRVRVEAAADVVDLGCGPGNLTALLGSRWPDADVTGVDSSAEMVAAAGSLGSERLRFVVGDLAAWEPAGEVDVVVANAALHWVPWHVDLLGRFASWLRPGGALAFQVPDNFTEPSHTLLHDLRVSPRWRDRLGDGADRTAGVERPERYLRGLVDAGLDPDVWQTEYLHVLPGDDAVLDWVRGTALRPVLSVLDPAEQEEFVASYAEALRAAYPRDAFGTVFPFRRTFAVGHRPPLTLSVTLFVL